VKILIAMQDENQRRCLAEIMQAHGYGTQFCADGLTAWHALQSDDAPRIAILDWLLPHMDGSEICTRLRSGSDHRYTYCILLSTTRSIESANRLIEAGADDAMTYPFDPNELLCRVRSARRILELQDQLLAARAALRFETTHDGGTGLLNRLGIGHHLHREFERSIRFGNTLGILLIDLDHFRLINESFGYHAGDVVLREAASRIRNTVRSYDVIGRYGADEFLVLSPESSPVSLIAQAERILKIISTTPVAFEEQEIIITASIGVATSDDRTENELVHAADGALKLSKQKARNSIEFAHKAGVESGPASESSKTARLN
jgi:two-component system, cell cycle response regulator